MMVEKYGSLTALEISRRVGTGATKAADVAETALQKADTEGRRLNAVITVCHDKARRQAEKIDRLIKDGHSPPPMAGVPVIIKDNIVCSGYPTTCGSHILENYIPPYDAACVAKLEAAGAIIIAKANMDEFAMGSSNETSAFGPVVNPINENLVPGGSSGGSCAAVAAGIVPLAYGSDTGGSVRQPAGFCGVVGLKPSYGAVSRYGLTAFASSTDQIGPIARNVTDCALGYEAVAGRDPLDATSAAFDHPPYLIALQSQLRKKFRIGIPREYMTGEIEAEVRTLVLEVIEKLRMNGHIIKDISLPHTEYAAAVYYILAAAEASANLARFDGARYGISEGRDSGLASMYSKTRSRGFGTEVKRRIMLGTFALSAGYYDAYYGKAMKVRQLITKDFEQAWDEVDVIITATSPTAAFKRGEKLDDPLAMYLSDILTVPASLAGIPAISIPCGRTSDGRPVGLQIMAPCGGEAGLLTAAAQAEQLIGYDHAKN